MRVLALTHGPSVGPGVFADAVRAGGHELVEQQVPIDGAPTAAGGCGDRPRRRHAPRRGGAARLATARARVPRRPARERHARARRLPRLAAARPGSRGERLSLAGARGRLAAGRADRGGRNRSRRRVAAGAVRRLPVAPLHARAPGGRRRAGAQPRLPAGVPARGGVGRPVPPRGARRRRSRRGSARTRTTSPTRRRSALRRATGSTAGTSSDAGSAPPFWQPPSRARRAATRPATTRARSRGSSKPGSRASGGCRRRARSASRSGSR